MNNQQIVLHGRIRPDGTLQIDEKVNLPPGPIQVTIETCPERPSAEDTRSVLKKIQERKLARGTVSRSKEEIDAEIEAMRNEDEQRNGKAILLSQAGALADDESLADLRSAIYRERGRPETEER